MDRRLLFTTTLIIISASATVYAQENRPNFSQFASRLSFIRNPFESQLPEKEKPADEPIVHTHEPEPVARPPRKEEPSRRITPPPPPVKKDPVPTTTISGIIWNSDRPKAIINEKVVGVGDIVSGIKITNIRKSGIDGLFQGRPVTLKP